MRPILRYFGGKYLLAPWIISHFPKHRIYVEPFGGAASVLLRKPRSYAEVYNDLDDGVVALFQVLRNKENSEHLRLQLERTPYSRREFELASSYTPDPVERARRLIIRSYMGFGADSAIDRYRATGFRSNSNRSGSTPAHDWANYAAAISEIHERLSGIVIEHRDAIEVMTAHDGPETLHYVDPPYIPETRTRDRARNYNHEMNLADHEKLLAFVKTLKGSVLISGYEHPIYERELSDWQKQSKHTHADGAKKRVECLWINAQAAIERSLTASAGGERG